MTTNNLKDTLKNKVEETQNKPVTTFKKTLAGYLEQMKPEIAKALPKHLDADRLTRIVLTCVRLNPKLAECSVPSMLGAVMQSAQLGLEPGVLGQSYLIPFWNGKNKCYDAQYMIGYRGLMELVQRSGRISTLYAGVVKENDSFEYEYGLEPKLSHKPLLKGERGEAYCYYAYAILKDGGAIFHVMSKEDINRIRDKYCKAKEYSPWQTEYDEMAKKTVLKKLIKYLPISIEIAKQVLTDETVKSEICENMAEEVLDITVAMNEDYFDAEVVEEIKKE